MGKLDRRFAIAPMMEGHDWRRIGCLINALSEWRARESYQMSYPLAKLAEFFDVRFSRGLRITARVASRGRACANVVPDAEGD
jgi:hypothetical protein